ncbi:MAG: DUF4956 domain-containing protein [Solobacterium sp.]|nr:DUF4956 domain-containing protein [Erysipelotrichaceae bacterium]MBQ9153959.1 DUF4956 domain-containing protein [Solobacterium sp.]
MFNSVLTQTASYLSIQQVLVCTAASVICGLIIACTYRMTDHPSRNFLISAAILPAIVEMVILMVNGNLGAGVAVAGTFSLVRFRSLPGKASDIVMIFLAMAAGLMTGMGYAVLAAAMTVLLCAVWYVISRMPLLDEDQKFRNVRIMVPEDLDYTEAFDDILEQFTSKHKLVSSKTVNLGTMYALTYELRLKDEKDEKKLIDALRTRNGNLSIICGHQSAVKEEL